MHRTVVSFRRLWLAAALACSSALGAHAAKRSTPIIPPGPYAVGSSNIEVRAPATTPIVEYLKGAVADGERHYLSSLLAHPEAALNFTLSVPLEPVELFGQYAGQRLPMVLYVLYPTTPDNARPDYRFPYEATADNVFPHMQRAGERPVFARASAKYPLIVFSHGYEGHGLWDLDHMKFLAAHGYIVASIFYGDGRADGRSNYGMRPLALRQAISYLLEHPDYRNAIDAGHVGISGSSFGGYATLATLGGRRGEWDVEPADPRVKAGFGIVPALSYGDTPYFGAESKGLQRIRQPLMVVYGERDTVVNASLVEHAVPQAGGVSSAVLLEGEEHILSQRAWPIVYTWEVLFFDSWLKHDARARRKLYGSDSVAGEVVNRKTSQHLVTDVR